MKRKHGLWVIAILAVCLTVMLCGCRKGGEIPSDDPTTHGESSTQKVTGQTEAVTDPKGSTVTDAKGQPVTRVVPAPDSGSATGRTSAPTGDAVIDADDLFGDDTTAAPGKTTAGTKVSAPSRPSTTEPSTSLLPSSKTTEKTEPTKSTTSVRYEDNKGWSPLLP